MRFTFEQRPPNITPRPPPPALQLNGLVHNAEERSGSFKSQRRVFKIFTAFIFISFYGFLCKYYFVRSCYVLMVSIRFFFPTCEFTDSQLNVSCQLAVSQLLASRVVANQLLASCQLACCCQLAVSQLLASCAVFSRSVIHTNSTFFWLNAVISLSTHIFTGFRDVSSYTFGGGGSVEPGDMPATTESGPAQTGHILYHRFITFYNHNQISGTYTTLLWASTIQ